jgi:hypothetical protein
MSVGVQIRSRLTLLVAIVAALAAALVLVRPAGSAIPASALVGRVTYADISGTTDLTTSIRSFQFKTEKLENETRATLGIPRVVGEVGARSPWITAAVFEQLQLTTITVTLYHPGTTTRFQQWIFTNALLTLDQQIQNGPASATPSEVVTWLYDGVTQTVYGSNGTTVTATFCFDPSPAPAC